MTEWIEQLRLTLDVEFGDQPVVASLATVDRFGRPKVRSIICRRINPDGSILYCTDSRSEKSKELAKKPWCGLVFWLPNLRQQFRLTGKAVKIDGTLRREMWATLSPATKATFFWPAPGRPRETHNDYQLKLFEDIGPSEWFSAMRIEPSTVEWLDLRPSPHHRIRWTRKRVRWLREEINP